MGIWWTILGYVMLVGFIFSLSNIDWKTFLLVVLPRILFGTVIGGLVGYGASWGLLSLWGWIYYDILNHRSNYHNWPIFFLFMVTVIVIGTGVGIVIGAMKGRKAALQSHQEVGDLG